MSISLHYADDDRMVSEGNDFINPVNFYLLIDEEEEEEELLYLDLKEMKGLDIQIYAEGETSDKWKFALDNNGEPEAYQDSLNINEAEGNLYFWVKASTSSDEEVKKDDSVTIEIRGRLEDNE